MPVTSSKKPARKSSLKSSSKTSPASASTSSRKISNISSRKTSTTKSSDAITESGAAYLSRLFSLHGRTAVVTGGGSGIGRRIAEALAAAGAQVVIVGRRRQLLLETAAAINDLSADKKRRQAAAVVADLSDLEKIPQIAKAICRPFGAPSIVINAAGVNLRSSSDPALSSADITLHSWKKTMDVNLAAPFFLSRELLPGLHGGGAIINIGSMQSVRAGLGDAAYGASKGGVAQLTRVMARAWGAQKITVNAILPGYFPSEMTEIVFANRKLSAKLAVDTLLGRNGALRDLEGAAVFLCSPAAAYITGIMLPIDGGFLAK